MIVKKTGLGPIVSVRGMIPQRKWEGDEECIDHDVFTNHIE